jgi:sodium-coupled neutral amino acid transporter 7/8
MPLEQMAQIQVVSSDTKGQEITATQTVGWFVTFSNFLSAILGCTVIAIPRSLVYIGIILSSIFLAIIGVLMGIASMMIVKLEDLLHLEKDTEIAELRNLEQASQNAEETEDYKEQITALEIEQKSCAEGFDSIVGAIINPFASKVSSLLTLVLLLSSATAYLIIGSDSLISFLRLADIDLSSFWWRALLVFCYWISFCGPLTIPKDIKVLGYASYFKWVCVGFYVVVIVMKSIRSLTGSGIAHDVVYADLGVGFFSAFSFFMLPFALPIFSVKLLKNYDESQFSRGAVISLSIIAGYIILLSTAILAYLVLGSKIQDNVLLSFPANDVLILITRGAFLFLVTCSFQMVSVINKDSLSSILYGINDISDERISTKQTAVIIFIANSIPLIIAAVLPSIGPILSIGGSIGGILVDFVFPPLLWFNYFRTRSDQFKWYSLQNIGCFFLIGFGIVGCVISTYLAVVDAITAN